MNNETNEIVATTLASRDLQEFSRFDAVGPDRRDEEAKLFTTREVLRILGRWRWLIMTAAVVALAYGVVSTILTPKKYRATTQVELALQVSNLTNDKQTEDAYIADSQFMTTQLGLLRSRDLAEKVARTLDAGLRSKLAPNISDPTAQIAATTGAIAGGLRIEAIPGSRLINITFECGDPTLAAQVANGVADGYIASNLERKYEASAFARKFLEQRITQVKAALEKSERDLVAYDDQQKIVMVGGSADKGGNSSSQSLDSQSLEALNTALATAQNERIAAEQKMRSEGASAGRSQASTSLVVTGLQAERAKLAVDYQEKLGTFKPGYPEMVAMRARIAELDQQIHNAQSEISGSVSSAYAGEYQAALGREHALMARVEQLKNGVMDLRNRQIQHNILAREVETNRTLYDGLLQRFKEVSTNGGVQTSLISIVDRALVPGGPFSPSLTRNLMIALVIGILLGTGLAFAIEFVDDSIKDPEDVKNRLRLTLLGVVPTVPKGMTLLEVLNNATSPQSEAYLSIRTSIQFTTAGGAPRSLLLTSSQPAEGKSSSCFAIARGFASMGKSVLLIDADMRKPSFSVPSGSDGKGLSALLASPDDLRAHVIKTEVPNLTLLPSGPIPPNPVELLGGERLREVLREAEGIFDLLIFDSPPVMGMADVPLLASVCDATIFVVQAGRTRRPGALRALARLELAGARVVGGIMTKFDLKGASYGYGYGDSHGYTYGQVSQKESRFLRKSEESGNRDIEIAG